MGPEATDWRQSPECDLLVTVLAEIIVTTAGTVQDDEPIQTEPAV